MSKKRRGIELMKNLLIAALVCSALWLAQESRLFRLPGMLEAPRQSGQESLHQSEQSEMLFPLHMAVMQERGCYGVQYDGGQLAAAFNRMAPALNEALSGAETPQSVAREEWERLLLSAPGVFFDFGGAIPLQVLSGWLSGKENPNLTARIQYLLLAVEEQGRVVLAYRDEDSGEHLICPAPLVNRAHLRSVVEQVRPNGAMFACQEADYAQMLAPYTIITPQTPSPREYLALNPISERDDQRLDELLEALSFPVGITTVYDTPEGRKARSGNDTLSISNDGIVSYYSADQEQRYPVKAAEGGSAVFSAVDGAAHLVRDALDLWRGEARVYLARVDAQGSNSWRLQFCYALNGTSVQVGQRGWAATVLVERGYITEFELQLRTYSGLEQTTLVLPQRQAAAAMVELGKQGGQLRLCYQDNADVVQAGWVIGE